MSPNRTAREPIKILALHNRYRQRGGEDEVFEQEVRLLRSKGHTVIEYVETNDDIEDSTPWSNALEAIWSARTVKRLRDVIRHERPAVAHFHNTFARISPAAYYACHQAGVPVVQTLHNFRIGCLNACCSTDQGSCEQCVSNLIPLAGIVKGCYHDSRTASAAMAAITTTHKLLGTYRDQVDAYIALTEFARQIHIRSGVPASKLFVKPNFAETQPSSLIKEPREFALFVGRLCPEKGIATLIEAWEKTSLAIPLRIVGDGPSAGDVARAAARIPGVEWLGSRPHSEVLKLMRRAQFLVMPSLLYENFPLCIVEAFGAALPCLVSGHGSMSEIVEHERTGLHFRPGNAEDLAAKIHWMVNHPKERQQMGNTALKLFSAKFTSEVNYNLLMEIYGTAARFRNSGKSLQTGIFPFRYSQNQTVGTSISRI